MSPNPKISTDVDEIRHNDSHKNFAMTKNGLSCTKWVQIQVFGTKCKFLRDELHQNTRKFSGNKGQYCARFISPRKVEM